MEHSQASVGASVENLSAFVQDMITRGQQTDNTGTTFPSTKPHVQLLEPSSVQESPTQAKSFDNPCAHHPWDALLALTLQPCTVAMAFADLISLVGSLL